MERKMLEAMHKAAQEKVIMSKEFNKLNKSPRGSWKRSLKSEDEWHTGNKLWEKQGKIAYLIGYFLNIRSAHKIKKQIEKKYGIEVHADIRLIGIVKKESD